LKQFDIALRSFADVQDFVEIATIQPFRVLVGHDHVWVNAKSFMGLFSLDFGKPIHVRANCSQVEYDSFRVAAGKYLA
jgi:hypothetical protein